MSNDWFELLGSPKFVVAPMVDASELAWRMLCRRHGAQLCYTPMFHSNLFVKDQKYRNDSLATCADDRPLFVQFCGNNPEIMAAAAKLVEGYCDAIDINLGCPQSIAKRGRYGSFLQDEWDLLRDIVASMSQAVTVPITCKVRIFESVEKTVAYALMLQKAGCKLLTVHGRTRDQKGPLTGIANWDHIRAVRKAVSIPVFANGNIQCIEDVYRCLEYTQANGVMSAEGNLTNPALFEGINPVTWEIVEEYLDLVRRYPCPTSYIRGHLFKIFHKIFSLKDNNEIRETLATAQNLEHFQIVCSSIKQKYLLMHEGKSHENIEDLYRTNYNLILPPWICQPYVRMSPAEHTQKMQQLVQSQDHKEDKLNEDGNQISRKKMKKLKRIMRKPGYLKKLQQYRRREEICINNNCPNPLGNKCVYQLCKKCCKNKCFNHNLDCSGHRILVYTRRQMAKQFGEEFDKQKSTDASEPLKNILG